MKVIKIEERIDKRVVGGSMPDIDIDHDQIRRDEVKRHLIDKYGKEQCCSVGTFGTLQLKAAIKDLCRIYNVDFETSNTVTKLIPKESTTFKGALLVMEPKIKTKIDNKMTKMYASGR